MERIHQMICQPLGNGPSIDTSYKELHNEVQKLFIDANKAYRKNKVRKFEKICIYSGKRSVKNQVNLYRKYLLHKDYGGKYAKGADNPGYSLHEYGCAIDIIRTGDSSRLKRALLSNGWSQVKNPEESHHFFASKYPSFKAVETKRKVILKKYYNIKKQIKSDIENEIEKHEKMSELKTQLRVHYQEKLEIKRIMKKITRTNTYISELSEELTDLKEEHRELVSEKVINENELKNYKYSDCDNGYDYDDCDHNDLKALYDEKVRKKKSYIINLKKSILKNKREQQGIKRQINQNNKIRAGFETSLEKVRKEFDAITQLRDNLKKEVKKKQLKERQLRKTISKITGKIQSEIDAFIYAT